MDIENEEQKIEYSGEKVNFIFRLLEHSKKNAKASHIYCKDLKSRACFLTIEESHKLRFLF